MAIKISGSTIIDDSRVLINTGNVGVGTTNPTSAVDSDNTGVVHAGIVTANSFYGSGANLTGITASQVSGTGFEPDADENLFAGTCAGGTYDPSSGSACHNIFLGSCAGKSITEGDFNVFLGRCAGTNNSTGGSNNFIGYDAGRSHTTGYKNNFFGNCAGYAHESGNSNNFIGSYACLLYTSDAADE